MVLVFQEKLEEKIENDNLSKYNTIGKAILGVSSVVLLYANIMFGFAPTIDLLNNGATKKQIEHGEYSLRLAENIINHSPSDYILMKDATIIKNLTKPGRELAYWSFSKGFR